MKNLMKKTLNKKGFTLVELIVVIAIVAVLAVIGIPAIAGQVNKAQMSTATANAKSIATQAQMIITKAETEGSTAIPADGVLKVDACEAAGLKAADCIVFTTDTFAVDNGPDGIAGNADDVTGTRVKDVEFKVGTQTGKYTRS